MLTILDCTDSNRLSSCSKRYLFSSKIALLRLDGEEGGRADLKFLLRSWKDDTAF